MNKLKILMTYIQKIDSAFQAIWVILIKIHGNLFFAVCVVNAQQSSQNVKIYALLVQPMPIYTQVVYALCSNSD